MLSAVASAIVRMRIASASAAASASIARARASAWPARSASHRAPTCAAAPSASCSSLPLARSARRSRPASAPAHAACPRSRARPRAALPARDASAAPRRCRRSPAPRRPTATACFGDLALHDLDVERVEHETEIGELARARLADDHRQRIVLVLDVVGVPRRRARAAIGGDGGRPATAGSERGVGAERLAEKS